MSSKKITNLDSVEAKTFFMDEKNYKNFDIPDYFHFTDLLSKTSVLLLNKNICDVCKKHAIKKGLDRPKNYENVNYTFLDNKDGAFAWRPMQLIHPVLFVDLVNSITDESNWKYITERFQTFSDGCVECISIPRVSQDDEESHKASQVTHWWEKIEQRSIKMSLEYDYVFSTDITNCYGSIYTHSIEWALTEGGKREVKDNMNNGSTNNTLGAQIDEKMRNMTNGQTNGIPQGSTLTDFIAEIVLGYGDIELTKLLHSEKISKKEFYILRYRDDYRIFVNNPAIGQKILKCLNTVLYDLGMKMNPGKTSESSDVIVASIKKEKLERIFLSPVRQSYQKEALRIYQLSKKYPNSGLVAKELGVYYDRVEYDRRHDKYLKNTDIEVIIAIFSMIALNSPKVINWVSAIISILLEYVNTHRKEVIVKMIHARYGKVPNTSLVDVWLQRISAPLGIELNYADSITEAALQNIDNSKIWESLWLDEEIAEKINSIEISNLRDQIKNKSISPVMPRAEVELFRSNYND